MIPTPALESAAEAAWQAESIVFANRDRFMKWGGLSEATREKYRAMMRAALDAYEKAMCRPGEGTTPEPIWAGRPAVSLRWGKDGWGIEGRALFMGQFYLGGVTERPNCSSDRPWRPWIMTSEDGVSGGWFPTEQEAKAALVEAVLKELRDE